MEPSIIWCVLTMELCQRIQLVVSFPFFGCRCGVNFKQIEMIIKQILGCLANFKGLLFPSAVLTNCLLITALFRPVFGLISLENDLSKIFIFYFQVSPFQKIKIGVSNQTLSYHKLN